jgi:bacillithiol system protein YtxJ
MNWIFLQTLSQLDSIIQRSYEIPCLIFKHSTRCSISSLAKYRLESDWQQSGVYAEAYFLDLLAFRDVSNAIAENFTVYHESPQILLIHNGECVLDASHLDISVEEVKEVLAAGA